MARHGSTPAPAAVSGAVPRPAPWSATGRADGRADRGFPAARARAAPAASSSASGSPSSRVHSSATSSALSGVTAKPGRPASPRSRNRATASNVGNADTAIPLGGSGSGGTAKASSSATCSWSPRWPAAGTASGTPAARPSAPSSSPDRGWLPSWPDPEADGPCCEAALAGDRAALASSARRNEQLSGRLPTGAARSGSRRAGVRTARGRSIHFSEAPDCGKYGRCRETRGRSRRFVPGLALGYQDLRLMPLER
jgi:hypothetical protein